MLADLKPFFGHVRALFPDIRGHGLSTRFERSEDCTYPRKLEDLLLWLDAIGVRQAIWGGASMGAALSLWAAVHAPAVVRAVVSISGPAHAPVESDKRWWAEHRPLVAAGRFNDYFDENIRLRMGEKALARLKAWPERYDAVTAKLARHSVPSLLAVPDETYSRADWLADCARIQCPALIISGSEDHYPTVEMSRRVAETISGASSTSWKEARISQTAAIAVKFSVSSARFLRSWACCREVPGTAHVNAPSPRCAGLSHMVPRANDGDCRGASRRERRTLMRPLPRCGRGHVGISPECCWVRGRRKHSVCGAPFTRHRLGRLSACPLPQRGRGRIHARCATNACRATKKLLIQMRLPCRCGRGRIYVRRAMNAYRPTSGGFHARGRELAKAPLSEWPRPLRCIP